MLDNAWIRDNLDTLRKALADRGIGDLDLDRNRPMGPLPSSHDGLVIARLTLIY